MSKRILQACAWLTKPLTALFALIAAYGQRDAWVAGDWWSFFCSSVVLGVFYWGHTLTLHRPTTPTRNISPEASSHDE